LDTPRDPLSTLSALNIGDFALETLISDDLLEKIQQRLGQQPDRLRMQLDELVQLYSVENTLAVLGFSPSEGGFIFYDSLTQSLQTMLGASQVDLMLKNPSGSWHLMGTTHPDRARHEAFLQANLQPDGVVSIPLGALGFLYVQVDSVLAPEWNQFLTDAGALLHVALLLQHRLWEAQVLLEDPETPVALLHQLRSDITDTIADLTEAQKIFAQSLALAADSRHQTTRGHSLRVAETARKVAQALELNEKTVDLIYYAGLFSALGKISIPNPLLHKKESLTEADWVYFQQHPNFGVSMLVGMHALSEVIPYVQAIRERWDGSGLPDGLSGQSIPLGARILSVADAYCALTQPRVYRQNAYSPAEALSVLQEEMNVKWDPTIVETLSRIAAS
jgi:hypothetical protein